MTDVTLTKEFLEAATKVVGIVAVGGLALAYFTGNRRSGEKTFNPHLYQGGNDGTDSGPAPAPSPGDSGGDGGSAGDG
jgi:hypothetical protein